jgi:ankyrin repeat protein
MMLVCCIPIFCGPIHDAAKTGNLAKVKAILGENPELISSRDDDGWTPLHWAAVNGNGDVATFLLANKPEINAGNNIGGAALHIAAEFGAKAVVGLLLANGAEVNAGDRIGSTPLHEAAEFGNKKEVASLLSKGANVNAKGFRGQTPLHAASAEGYRDVVQLLLAGKADVAPGIAADIRLYIGRPCRAASAWRKCCWPTRPMPMPGTTKVIRLCALLPRLAARTWLIS